MHKITAGVVLFAGVAGTCYAQKSADECREEVGQRATPEATQQAVMTCILDGSAPPSSANTAPSLAAVPPAVDWSRIRADNAAALRFIKVNAGRFKTEVDAVGKPMRIRAHLSAPMFTVYTKYDGATLDVESFISVSTFRFLETCSPAGEFIGQNGFGARFRVRRQNCEFAEVEAPDFRGVTLKGALPLPPSEYRKASANGVDLEVDFEVAAGFDNRIARRQQQLEGATVSDPIEQRANLWTMYGTVRRVRMMLGGPEGLTVFQR